VKGKEVRPTEEGGMRRKEKEGEAWRNLAPRSFLKGIYIITRTITR